MGSEAALLLIRVKADSSQAEKTIKGFFGVVSGLEKKTADDAKRIASDLLKFREAADRARLVSAEKTAKGITSAFGKERDAQGRLLVELRSAKSEVGKAYDGMAASAKSNMDSIVRSYQRADDARARFARNTARTGGAAAPALPPKSGLGFSPGMLAGGAAVAFGGFALSQAQDAVKLAADLEQSLDELRQASGATDAQMDKMGKTARDLGADITLPATSSVDAAHAMLALAQSGLSVEDACSGARGALQLAAASSLDVKDAALITAHALNAFGMEGSRATEVADLLTAAHNNTGKSINTFADAIANGGQEYKKAGFSLRDFITDVTLMQKAGISGASAGTSLRVALQRLGSGMPSVQKEMDALGLSVYDASGKFVTHEELIKRVSAALAGKSEKERNAAAQVLFGTRASSSANIVLAAGIEKNKELADKIGKTGTAAETAGAKMHGFNGAMEGFKSAADTFKEENAAPVLKFLTSIINGASQGLEKWRKLKEEIQKPYNLPKVADFTQTPHASTAEQARLNSGVKRIYLRVAKEELSMGETGAYPVEEGLQNNLNEGERAQVIGVLMTRYGLPRDHNFAAIKATIKRLQGEILADAMQAEVLPSQAEKMKPTKKPLPGTLGGGKKFTYQASIEARAQADATAKEYTFDKTVEAYSKLGGKDRRATLDQIVNKLASDETTIANKRHDKLVAAGKGDEAESELTKDLAQIKVRRDQRNDKIAEAEERYTKAMSDLAGDAEKKKRDDKLRAALTNAQSNVDAAKSDYEFYKDKLGTATTDDQVKAYKKLMGQASTDQLRAELVKIGVQFKKDYRDDPTNTESAKATRDASKRKAEEEDRNRSNQMNDEADKRTKAIKEKGAELLKKQQEEAEKAFKDNAEGFKQWLDADAATTEAAMEKARSLQEEKGLIDALVENRRQQAELEYQITMHEIERERALSPLNQAQQITTAFIRANTGELPGTPSAAGAVDSVLTDAYFPQQKAARQKLRNDLAALGQQKNKLEDDAYLRFGVDYTNTQGVTAEEQNSDMITLHQPDGTDWTGTRKAAMADPKLRAQLRQQQERGQFNADVRNQFQSGAADLLSSGVQGKLKPGDLQNFMRQQGQTLASSASHELIKQIASGEIKKTFGDFIRNLDRTGKTFGEVGLGLMGLANILGAGGKKKQKNSIIGGIVGFGLGSIIPGLGNLGGLAVGSGLGGFFAEGGRPPVGRAVMVGEREPEVFIADRPGTILNQKQLAALSNGVAGDGGGGQTNIFYGDIHDRADADHIINTIDRRRVREARVK